MVSILSKLSCIMVLLLSVFVSATSMFAVDLQNLTLTSEKIVQAKVTGIVTQWSPDSTQIITYIRMNIVDDMIGADEDNEIIVKQSGGKIGNVIMSVEGTTTYKVGDENIVFLRKDFINNASFQTLGLYQGKYRIFTDNTGVKRVAQDVNGKVILYKSAKQAGGIMETGNNMLLDEFKNKVITYLLNK